MIELFVGGSVVVSTLREPQRASHIGLESERQEDIISKEKNQMCLITHNKHCPTMFDEIFRREPNESQYNVQSQ